MRTVNISEEAFKKFMAIKESRPQDASRAATFDHIIYVYEEQQFKPVVRSKESGSASPIIDAEKLQNAPRTAADLLREKEMKKS
jgi:hypothetical protein